MTVLNPRDFYLEVRKGNIPGHSLVHKFGRNDAVPNGSWQFVNLLGFTAWPISSVVPVRIKAGGNAADAAAGAGAREITVQGIDSNLDEISVAIATAGTSGSSNTSETFWRIHRAWVSSAGTYGAANTGAVTITSSAGDLIQIAAGEGQTMFSGFSVPDGKTGYLISANITVDGAKAADVRLMTRENLNNATAPVSSVRVKKYWAGVLGSLDYHPVAPDVTLPALTDIWVEARGGGVGTTVSANFELLLVDD